MSWQLLSHSRISSDVALLHCSPSGHAVQEERRKDGDGWYDGKMVGWSGKHLMMNQEGERNNGDPKRGKYLKDAVIITNLLNRANNQQ